MAKVTQARRGQVNGILKEIIGDIREEPLDRKEVWELMWKKDPDGGCTRSTSCNVKLFLTKKWPVLETACGSGLYLKLPEKSFYVGVDIAWKAVKDGTKRNPNANYVQADMNYLPFQEGVFEKSFSFNGIDFIGPYLRYAVKEMARATKTGGEIIFSANHSDFPIANGREFVEMEGGKLFGSWNPLYEFGIFGMDTEGIEALLAEVGAQEAGISVSTKKSKEGIKVIDTLIVKAIKRQI